MSTTLSATVRVLESQIDALAGRVAMLERQCRGLISLLLDLESKDPSSSRHTRLRMLQEDDHTSRSAEWRHRGERYDQVRILGAERQLGRDDERLDTRLRHVEARLERLDTGAAQEA